MSEVYYRKYLFSTTNKKNNNTPFQVIPIKNGNQKIIIFYIYDEYEIICLKLTAHNQPIKFIKYCIRDFKNFNNVHRDINIDEFIVLKKVFNNTIKLNMKNNFNHNIYEMFRKDRSGDKIKQDMKKSLLKYHLKLYK